MGRGRERWGEGESGREKGRDLIKCDFEDFGKKGYFEKKNLRKREIWKK
jgi:hypothetical protein